MPLRARELHAAARPGRGSPGQRAPAAEAAPTGPAVARILVVKLADLGDALTATPALRALRDTWPAAEIDVLTSPIGASALDGLDSVDRLWVADKHRFDSPLGVRGLPALAPLLARLRRRYDQLLLLHHLTTWFGVLKYAALVRFIAAGRSIGLDNGRGWFLDVRVPDHGFGQLHEVDYALAVAAAAGARPPGSPRLEIALDAASHARAAELLPGGDWIAVHAGGGAYSLARRWPTEAFADVARRLAQAASRLVLVGAAADREAHQALTSAAEAWGGPAPILDLTGRTSVKETAAVLRRCRLLVSNDSGVVHLAAAVGTPVVAIFGPSNDAAWGPYPPAEHQVIRASLPCSPCFYRGASLGTPEGCPTRDCLQLVTPEMVTSAALERLAPTRA